MKKYIYFIKNPISKTVRSSTHTSDVKNEDLVLVFSLVNLIEWVYLSPNGLYP